MSWICSIWSLLACSVVLCQCSALSFAVPATLSMWRDRLFLVRLVNRLLSFDPKIKAYGWLNQVSKWFWLWTDAFSLPLQALDFVCLDQVKLEQHIELGFGCFHQHFGVFGIFGMKSRQCLPHYWTLKHSTRTMVISMEWVQMSVCSNIKTKYWTQPTQFNVLKISEYILIKI